MKKATQNRVAFVLFKKFGKFRFYKIVLSSGGFLNPPRLVGFHFARLIIAHANFHRIAVDFKVGKRARFGRFRIFIQRRIGRVRGSRLSARSTRHHIIHALGIDGICTTAEFCFILYD